MSDRSLKKSLSGKSNRLADADENLDVFSVNRRGGLTSFDVLLNSRRRSFEQAKVAKPDQSDDDKIHVNDPSYQKNDPSLYTVPEVPLGTLSRLVLEARNVSSKLQTISTTRAGSRSENDPSSKPTRSNSTIRPSNIPTLRPSNIVPTFPTVRSSSAPKKTTTSASVSSPNRTVSRSLTPVSRKTPSRSSTPSRISTTTKSTAPSFQKAGDAQRSRSLTPRSKPQIAANSATPSSRTNVRSASVSSRPSVSATPRTPPRVKETVTLAFGRPVATTGNVNSPKRNASPDVARTRPKGHSASSSSSSSLIPTFSGASHTPASTKPVKPSATIADSSTRSGRKLSKASIQIANNHLDVSRNGKVGPNPFVSTMLYPHSVRASSLRKRSGSEGSSSSNQEEEEGKSLTKERNTEKMNDSARYDALLNVKDVKDTNWLLNLDDESNHSLIFDSAFDSPPEPFSPL